MEKLLTLYRAYREKILFLLIGGFFLFLTWEANKRYMVDLLVLFPPALIIGYIALTNFRNLWYLAVFFLPISISLEGYVDGANITFPTDLFSIMIFGLLIIKMSREKMFYMRFYEHPIFKTMMLFFLWLLVSSITSELPIVSFKVFAAYLWIFVAFYFLSVNIFRDAKTILYFFWLIAIAFVIVMLTIMFLYVSTGRNPFALRFNPMPFFNDHTVFGAFNATLIPLFFLFTFRGRFSRTYRLFSFVALLFFLMGLFFSYSRGAWMSTMIGMTLMGIFALRHWIRRLIIPLFVLFIIGATQLYNSYQTSQQILRSNAVSRKSFYDHIASVTNFRTDDSNAERVNRWNSAIRMWQDRPLFGFGPGTYAMIYPDYQESRYRTLVSTNRGDNGTAHNEFLLALSEMGFPGMIVMILFFAVPIYRGFRGHQRAREPNIKLVYLGCTFGIMIYAIHGLVNNFLDQDKIGVVMFGMFAVITALDIFHKDGVLPVEGGKHPT